MQEEIRKYTYSHLPNESWYETNFYPFIEDIEMRERLKTEFINARVIYKIFEGLQAKDELLLAQIKTQVIMYVSIQEAVINYVLFELNSSSDEVRKLLCYEKLIPIDIPKYKKEQLEKILVHAEKEILTYYKDIKHLDKTKIRYEHKVNACFNLGLITEKLKDELIQLYEYRNTVHLEAELRKKFTYDLNMGELAYRRVEGLSKVLSEKIQTGEIK
ncbi:hypothetical protein FOH38_22775 [Lysinibacillus fusiformis]|nr:hypothetical protein FOH38_22775 [Lysinibacillus fusiformis]